MGIKDLFASNEKQFWDWFEKLYDKKPDLPNWEIKKFRQRTSGFDIARFKIL